MQSSIRIPLLSSIIPSLAHAYLTHRQLSSPMTTPPAALILQQNPECMVLSSTLSICNSLTPGFTNMAPTKQAECLCYSETTFLPDIFDNAVKTCADFASTAVPSAYGAFSSLQDFCMKADVGGLWFLYFRCTSTIGPTTLSPDLRLRIFNPSG